MKIHLQFKNQKGFTLIEFMISITLFVIILGITFASNQNQIKTYYLNRELAEMQQNVRAALFLMNQEIKKAGLDSTGEAGAEIIWADDHYIQFTMDFTGGLDDPSTAVIDTDGDGIDNDGDGDIDEVTEWFDDATDDVGEHIIYCLSNDTNANTAPPEVITNIRDNGDGINDAVTSQGFDSHSCNIQRIDVNNGNQTDFIAYNVDALNFTYFDEDGNLLATPVANPNEIRNIEINIVGRTSWDTKTLREFTINRQYTNESGTEILPNQNDDIKRLQAFNMVFCRNIALH